MNNIYTSKSYFKSNLLDSKNIKISYIRNLLILKDLLQCRNDIQDNIIIKLNELFFNKTSNWYLDAGLFQLLDNFVLVNKSQIREEKKNFINQIDYLTYKKFEEAVNFMHLLYLSGTRYFDKSKINLFKFWYEKMRGNTKKDKDFLKFLFKILGVVNTLKIRKRVLMFMGSRRGFWKKRKFASNSRNYLISNPAQQKSNNKIKRVKNYVTVLIKRRLYKHRKIKKSYAMRRYRKFSRKFNSITRIRQIKNVNFKRLHTQCVWKILSMLYNIEKELLANTTFLLNDENLAKVINTFNEAFFIFNRDFFLILPFILLYKDWNLKALDEAFRNILSLLKKYVYKANIFFVTYKMIKAFNIMIRSDIANRWSIIENLCINLNYDPILNFYKLFKRKWKKRKLNSFVKKQEYNLKWKNKKKKKYTRKVGIPFFNKAKNYNNMFSFFFKNDGYWIYKKSKTSKSFVKKKRFTNKIKLMKGRWLLNGKKKLKKKLSFIKESKVGFLKLIKKSKILNSSIFNDFRRLNILYKCHFYVNLFINSLDKRVLVVNRLTKIVGKNIANKMELLYTQNEENFVINKILKLNDACIAKSNSMNLNGNSTLFSRNGLMSLTNVSQGAGLFKTMIPTNWTSLSRKFSALRIKKKRKILAKFFVNISKINVLLSNRLSLGLRNSSLDLYKYKTNFFNFRKLYNQLKFFILRKKNSYIKTRSRFSFDRVSDKRNFFSKKRIYFSPKAYLNLRRLNKNLIRVSKNSKFDKINFIVQRKLYRKYNGKRLLRKLISYTNNYNNLSSNSRSGFFKLFRFFKGFLRIKRKRQKKNWNRFKWEYMRKRAWARAKRKYKVRVKRYVTFKRNLVTKLGKKLKAKTGIGRLILRRVRRNFFFTFTDALGNVLYTANGGLFRIKKRKERFKWEVLRRYLKKFRKLALIYNIKRIIYYKRIRNVFMHKKLLKYFKIGDFDLFYIFPEYIRAHNGCRRRKKRRL